MTLRHDARTLPVPGTQRQGLDAVKPREERTAIVESHVGVDDDDATTLTLAVRG